MDSNFCDLDIRYSQKPGIFKIPGFYASRDPDRQLYISHAIAFVSLTP
ncbi:MAG: hypothetical protein SAL70_16065 [Scytonema sp. PMC 1070.18]|nr:hypothetical protein [Scytonema sp. PMC 1070.18]